MCCMVFEGVPPGWHGPHVFFKQIQFVANVPLGQFLGVQGMMQSEMPSVGFGSRVPEVYHIARCASDTFKVSKTFKKKSPCVRLSASTSDRHRLFAA